MLTPGHFAFWKFLGPCIHGDIAQGLSSLFESSQDTSDFGQSTVFMSRMHDLTVCMQVASVLVILYLFIGRQLRAWMPLFVYAHVVTGVSLLQRCHMLCACFINVTLPYAGCSMHYAFSDEC